MCYTSKQRLLGTKGSLTGASPCNPCAALFYFDRMGVCGGLALELGRHADLSTNFLCEETGIYTDEK